MVSTEKLIRRRAWLLKHPGEKVEGVLAIRLNADGTMTVQKMPGATSASAFTGFTSDALTYVR